jgi:hypothetical protein
MADESAVQCYEIVFEIDIGPWNISLSKRDYEKEDKLLS